MYSTFVHTRYKVHELKILTSTVLLFFLQISVFHDSSSQWLIIVLFLNKR